eukprot:3741648-Rhodomonas_salina.1
MDLVDCSSVIPEGAWDDYSTDIHRIIDSYNSTGEPLTVEDLAAALALQSILKSERYCTLGTSLLDQEGMDFDTLDVRARELDRNKKDRGRTATANQAAAAAASAESTPTKSNDCTSKVLDAIHALAVRVGNTGGNSCGRRNKTGSSTPSQNDSSKFCDHCQLPGHDQASCWRKEKGEEGLIYCRVCGKTGHHWRFHNKGSDKWLRLGTRRRAQHSVSTAHANAIPQSTRQQAAAHDVSAEALTRTSTKLLKFDSAATHHMSPDVEYGTDFTLSNLGIRVADDS